MGLTGFCKKNTAVTVHIIKILAYSAMKIKANLPALYSVLNPETNSLSPSAKSNGARLVSAKVVQNHVAVIGKRMQAVGSIGMVRILNILIEHKTIKADIRRSAIETS